MSDEVSTPLRLDTQAVYRIRLQGVLGEEWRERVGDMQVISYATAAQGRAPVTMLIGKLPDQAALAGVLNLVYSLGLPLLDVSCLGEALDGRMAVFDPLVEANTP